MKNGIKTLAMWLIIGIILIVLISSILSNTDNKLAYSELISKIESGEVKEVELSYDNFTTINTIWNINNILYILVLINGWN